MSDIAQKLGAELVKRFRDGTLNGQGGILVKQAAAEMERIEREEASRVVAGRLPYLARLSGDNFLRALKNLAADCKLIEWHTDGSGI